MSLLFARRRFFEQQIGRIFKGQQELGREKSGDIWVTAGEVLVELKRFQDEISQLIHDLESGSSWAFEKAKKSFNDLPDAWDQAVAFLKKRQALLGVGFLPPALLGKTVRGIFVDTTGTLFSQDLSTIKNVKLFDRIVEKSDFSWVYLWAESNLINLWQAIWNIDQQSRLGNVILLPKQRFSGLIVEETISSVSERELERNFGIRTLKHECV
ncbi:hypothetical protein FJ208_01560 [Candidatus Gribaldobacteria bacterium]|nr:hypothetical protein [Candidatus Gribaldobacteria bacterium]